MNEEEIKQLNLSSWEIVGWIRLWWHSLWRMLPASEDHRMASLKKIADPPAGTDPLPNVNPGSTICVSCMCGMIFWLHPDAVEDLRVKGIERDKVKAETVPL